MSAARKLVLLRSEKWDAIWIDYMRRPNFTELAEAHGLHRTTIARYAKRYGWEKRRRVERARRRLREAEEGLAFARAVGIEVAQHMIALCRDRSASLATLCIEAEEAQHPVWEVGAQARALVQAREELRLAEAGDPDPFLHAEDGLPPRDPRYERPTRWPEHKAMTHGYRGGREAATIRAFKAGKLRILRPAAS